MLDDMQLYSKLLDVYKSLSPLNVQDETFLEIAGYSDYENIASNMLAFFFDSERPHKLGTVFLESLLTAVQFPYTPNHLQNIVVEREAVTHLRCRLDLVITTSSLVIGIENKLFSGITNDLHHYREFLKSKANEVKKESGEEIQVVAILLTLYPYQKDPKYSDFIPVTYQQFFAVLMSRLGFSIIDASSRYISLLIDFIQTINHLRKGEDTMGSEPFHLWIKENKADVENLLQSIKEYRRRLKDRVKNLCSHIDLSRYKNNDVPCEQWFYDPPNGAIRRILVHDITIQPDINLFIDTILEPEGWSINFFCRNGGEPRKVQEFRSWVELHKIPFNLIDNSSRLGYGELLEFATPEIDVAEILTRLLDQILDGILNDKK